jgi:hypothetical protein
LAVLSIMLSETARPLVCLSFRLSILVLIAIYSLVPAGPDSSSYSSFERISRAAAPKLIATASKYSG